MINKTGNHPIIFSEVGGHASHNEPKDSEGDPISAVGCPPKLPVSVPPVDDCHVDLGNPKTFIRQETWTGGRVIWQGNAPTPGGRLLNIGGKMNPLNNQVFIQYSGIWGSPGDWYPTSGYWNPAYNETQKGADNFITAWCYAAAPDTPYEECHPKYVSR